MKLFFLFNRPEQRKEEVKQNIQNAVRLSYNNGHLEKSNLIKCEEKFDQDWQSYKNLIKLAQVYIYPVKFIKLLV